MNLSNLLCLLGVLLPLGVASAQSVGHYSFSSQFDTRAEIERFLTPQSQIGFEYSGPFTVQQDTTPTGQQVESRFPNPKSVLYKSLMIPGWGQIVNKQIWKVPIVYGLLGGVAGYSIYLTKRYHDYRAAYYNQTHDDMRFGPTPDYIPENTNQEELRSVRDRLRNRRDLSYLAFVVAYGLNAIDAYVYAHMRSFDVSEDLSMKADIKPALLAESSPGLTISIGLVNNSKTK